MILRIAGDGSAIEVDAKGIAYLINGLCTLRDCPVGTVVSSPSLINGEIPAVGVFCLVRVPDEDESR